MNYEYFGKTIVLLGIGIFLFGLIIIGLGRLGWTFFGKLPGDLSYEGKNFSVSFPIVTCIILSVALSLVFWLISLFRK